MEKTELIKGILKLGEELDNNHGMGSVMIIDDMQRLVDKYVEQLSIPRVRFSLLKRQELLKQAQTESEKKVDKQLPLDLQQHNYQNGIIEHLLEYIYGSNET